MGIAADKKHYHYHPVAEDRLVLITPNQPAFRTLQEQGVSGLSLLDRPMILREENSGTRQETEAFLLRNGVHPESLHIVAQIDNPEAIKSSVSRGLGVSIISVLAAREELLSEKLLAFELNRGAFRNIYLTWRKDAILSSAEEHFVNFVKSRPVIRPAL